MLHALDNPLAMLRQAAIPRIPGVLDDGRHDQCPNDNQRVADIPNTMVYIYPTCRSFLQANRGTTYMEHLGMGSKMKKIIVSHQHILINSQMMRQNLIISSKTLDSDKLLMGCDKQSVQLAVWVFAASFVRVPYVHPILQSHIALIPMATVVQGYLEAAYPIIDVINMMGVSVADMQTPFSSTAMHACRLCTV